MFTEMDGLCHFLRLLALADYAALIFATIFVAFLIMKYSLYKNSIQLLTSNKYMLTLAYRCWDEVFLFQQRCLIAKESKQGVTILSYISFNQY